MSLRSLSFVLVSGLCSFSSGCALGGRADADPQASGRITDVSQTKVKDQSIGNCWVYATASWAESLHRSHANEDVDLSESYWTYWSWFDRIVGGEVPDGGPLGTGGSWTVAADIASRYGYMFEGDFIPEEANVDRSARQDAAEKAIDASIKSGALATAAARSNRALVRQELDKAWQLGPDVTKTLDAAFGADVAHDFRDGGATVAAAPKVHAAHDLTTGHGRDPGATQDRELTLADSIGTGDGFGRIGTFAWNEIDYPEDPLERRHTQERVQRALHDELPVVITWYVDFNAMNEQGQFLAPPATPGPQGGHVTVLEDYQVSNVPGFGTLPAGVLETRPEALAAALDDKATIDFFRIKNSWGDYKSVPGTIGYHDLYMKYLDGPLSECKTDADEKPIAGTCSDATPLEGFALPPGY